ncbi:hypothetical protein [Ottowia testudinis]|uniref:Uncharacterized protein n=1 Tax=Ottowia testudinis TaxID=2816950 RepID=A0A975CGN8_9BURK|nr:hypothetical protein [Ottowia testudinis]QTD44756.1 hypothetical protein J1M35_16970 [Ottowia testudinis]
MQALQLFFYGNPNLAGMALALLGPLLLVAGVIGPGWLWITAGLYAVGHLLGRALTPRATRFEVALQNRYSADEIRARLAALLAQARPVLPAEMMQTLERVQAAVHEVLPALAAAGPSFDEGLFTVRETVLRYLPETLSRYAALPPVYRTTHVVQNGQTPRQILAEQLSLLEQQMNQVVANVAASDTQALLANGRFLKDKFERPDFLPA